MVRRNLANEVSGIQERVLSEGLGMKLGEEIKKTGEVTEKVRGRPIKATQDFDGITAWRREDNPNEINPPKGLSRRKEEKEVDAKIPVSGTDNVYYMEDYKGTAKGNVQSGVDKRLGRIRKVR